jgi:hypothetical protein
MRLATKAAIVLALASLVKSTRKRASLNDQADGALVFMAREQDTLASVVLDCAATEGMRALRVEGWATDQITQRVNAELRNAKVVPTQKRGDC